jgi:hypothetical protein
MDEQWLSSGMMVLLCAVKVEVLGLWRAASTDPQRLREALDDLYKDRESGTLGGCGEWDLAAAGLLGGW